MGKGTNIVKTFSQSTTSSIFKYYAKQWLLIKRFSRPEQGLVLRTNFPALFKAWTGACASYQFSSAFQGLNRGLCLVPILKRFSRPEQGLVPRTNFQALFKAWKARPEKGLVPSTDRFSRTLQGLKTGFQNLRTFKCSRGLCEPWSHCCRSGMYANDERELTSCLLAAASSWSGWRSVVSRLL